MFFTWQQPGQQPDADIKPVDQQNQQKKKFYAVDLLGIPHFGETIIEANSRARDANQQLVLR